MTTTELQGAYEFELSTEFNVLLSHSHRCVYACQLLKAKRNLFAAYPSIVERVLECTSGCVQHVTQQASTLLEDDQGHQGHSERRDVVPSFWSLHSVLRTTIVVSESVTELLRRKGEEHFFARRSGSGGRHECSRTLTLRLVPHPPHRGAALSPEDQMAAHRFEGKDIHSHIRAFLSLTPREFQRHAAQVCDTSLTLPSPLPHPALTTPSPPPHRVTGGCR